MTKKGYIYSFGMVNLELVMGRQPIDREIGEDEDLVKWLCNKIEKNNGFLEVLYLEFVDYFKEEMVMVMKVGLLYISTFPTSMPIIKRVVHFLQESNIEHKAKATSKDEK